MLLAIEIRDDCRLAPLSYHLLLRRLPHAIRSRGGDPLGAALLALAIPGPFHMDESEAMGSSLVAQGNGFG